VNNHREENIVPRGRSSRTKPLALGIAGSGQLDKKAITALLDDLIDGQTVSVIYIPVTSDDFTEEIEAVYAWAKSNDARVETASNEDNTKADKALGKVVEAADDDFDAGESAGKAIVELLGVAAEENGADARLLMFFDPDQEEDVVVFEEAHNADIGAFDLCDSLSPMSFGDDDGGSPEPTPEPEPEPEPAPARSRRGRAAKEAPADEPDEPADDQATESREELLKWSLVELKRKAKELDPKRATTASLKGLDKAQVIDGFLLGDEDAQAATEAEADANAAASREPADEAQATLPGRRGRRGAAEPQEGAEGVDGDSDTREDVFARLRGNREAAERIASGMASILRGSLELTEEEDQPIEVASGALAAALMVFAEFLITEVRRPKSAGRPRKDGTEAQPRQADPEAPKPRRGRRSA
jgi:hypothetical protein